MDRIYGSSAAPAPPTYPTSPSTGYPQSANPGLGLAATKPGPWWYYMINEEIRNVIVAGGITPLGATVNQLQAAISAMIAAQAPQLPAGVVLGFSGTTAPTGFIKANGALLNRTTYAALWAFAQASGNITASDAAWGVATTPGKYSPGDGSTTFRIPDLRGLFLRNFDDGAGVDSGRTFGSYQTDDFLSHTHAQTSSAINNVNNGYGLTGGGTWYTGPNGVPSGSTGGTETRPKNAALLACLKY